MIMDLDKRDGRGRIRLFEVGKNNWACDYSTQMSFIKFSGTCVPYQIDLFNPWLIDNIRCHQLIMGASHTYNQLF
jgi:hypothetical protein